MKSAKVMWVASVAVFVVMTSVVPLSAQQKPISNMQDHTASSEAAGERPTALTESGVVVGRRAGHMNEFLGIPYAAPPVGVLRWRPPKRYGFFPGYILQATQFGSECAQPGGSSSEDCLGLMNYLSSHLASLRREITEPQNLNVLYAHQSIHNAVEQTASDVRANRLFQIRQELSKMRACPPESRVWWDKVRKPKRAA